jgi:hypothetical protein
VNSEGGQDQLGTLGDARRFQIRRRVHRRCNRKNPLAANLLQRAVEKISVFVEMGMGVEEHTGFLSGSGDFEKPGVREKR